MSESFEYNGTIIEMFDRIKLKDGRTGHIVEIFDNDLLVDIELGEENWDGAVDVKKSQILSVISNDEPIGRRTRNSAKTLEKYERILSCIKRKNLEQLKVLSPTKSDVLVKDTEGNTLLMHASRKRDTDIIRFIVDCGSKINAKDYAGRTPLIKAVKQQNLEVVALLLELGANIEICDNNGESPLIHACCYGSVNLVEALIDKGAKINKNAKSYISPLSAAMYHCNFNVALFLIDKGAKVNFVDDEIITPLYFSICNHNYDIEFIEKLLHSGANPNYQTKTTYAPLYYAIGNQNLEQIKLLIEFGAKIDQNLGNSDTPFLYACRQGNKKILDFLILKGADISKKSVLNETSLDIAIKNKHFSCVDFLINQITNSNLHKDFFDSALLVACEHYEINIAKRLLELGADPNYQTKEGSSAFFETFSFGYKPRDVDILQLLVDYGANIDIKGDGGYTPLMKLVSDFHISTNDFGAIEFLLQNGANPNAKDENDVAVLMLAASRANSEVVELLIKKGADIFAKDYRGLDVAYYASSAGNEKNAYILNSYIKKAREKGVPKDNSRKRGKKSGIFLLQTYITGTNYVKNYHKIIDSIHSKDTLTLVREPDNKYDFKAIRVHSPNGEKLGYIPRESNQICANLMDAGKTLYAMLDSRESNATIVIFMKDE